MGITQVRDNDGNVVPGVFRFSAHHNVEFDASVQSSAFAAGTTFIRVASTEPCYLVFGENPTATDEGMFLPANVPTILPVVGAEKVAAIKAVDAGILSISELS